MLDKVIPAYLYYQYADDDNLQAFVIAYNKIAQSYVDWFSSINLPFYPGLSGSLLDWVAEGVYDKKRPLLPSGITTDKGVYQSIMWGEYPWSWYDKISSGEYFATNDDIFKRILTWHLYKADGKHFNIRWLKRRVMRFLIGENGLGDADQTFQIGVTISGNDVEINIIQSIQIASTVGTWSSSSWGELPWAYTQTTTANYSKLEYAEILKAGIESGILELPFDYNFTVTIT